MPLRKLPDFIAPLLVRGGASIAAMLSGYGVATDHAEAIAAGIVSAILVVADLILGWYRRKAIAKQATREALK